MKREHWPLEPFKELILGTNHKLIRPLLVKVRKATAFYRLCEGEAGEKAAWLPLTRCRFQGFIDRIVPFLPMGKDEIATGFERTLEVRSPRAAWVFEPSRVGY